MRKSVAVFARQTRSLMKCETEILNDAQLRRWVERIPESVSESEIWIDVPIDRCEWLIIAVVLQVPVRECAG